MSLITDDFRSALPVIKALGIGDLGQRAIARMESTSPEKIERATTKTTLAQIFPSLSDLPIETASISNHETMAANRIATLLDGADLVFIVTALDEDPSLFARISRAAMERGILTLAAVTTPAAAFATSCAVRRGLRALRETVDTLFVLPVSFVDEPDRWLHHAVRSITDLIMIPGLLCFDFSDVVMLTKNHGWGALGVGQGGGPERAEQAIQAALACPSLGAVDPASIRGVIVNITAGLDLCYYEIVEVIEKRLREVIPSEALSVLGTVLDPHMSEKCEVTLAITGFQFAC